MAAAASFETVAWDAALERDARRLIALALEEDLGGLGAEAHDWTSELLVDDARPGEARLVAREAGVAAGLGIVPWVIEAASAELTWEPALEDAQPIEAGALLGTLGGSGRQLLTCERTLLNLLGRLCGIATLTRQYVDQLAGTSAALYDTRKTTPGWRRLEKYAVRCGGGVNHRTGLYDAVMIKDNHLALAQSAGLQPAEAVQQVREQIANRGLAIEVVEIEVDTLAQLRAVLPVRPDVVLLDNMSCEELREAVALRNELAADVVLEASGGVTLQTLHAIGETGVDRISVGALTHSARGLDIGLDWGGAH